MDMHAEDTGWQPITCIHLASRVQLSRLHLIMWSDVSVIHACVCWREQAEVGAHAGVRSTAAPPGGLPAT